MARSDAQVLEDLLAAIGAIANHMERGDLTDSLVFDAVRMRLVEIGEAVKSLKRETTDLEPEIPWSLIARMRDRLTHRYFDNEASIIEATVNGHLPQLEGAVRRLLAAL